MQFLLNTFTHEKPVSLKIIFSNGNKNNRNNKLPKTLYK